MKKLILSMAVIAVFAASTISCKKTKDAINCVEVAQKYSSALQAYGLDQSKPKCDALKASITEYMNSSCVTAEQKAVLQETATSLTCQ